MKTLSSQLIAAKGDPNSDNPMVWLWRVSVDGTPANDLRFAVNNTDITYDQNDGSGSKTWTASTVKLQDVSEEEGSWADVEAAVSNVDRDAAKRLADGEIRDQRVTALLVSLEDIGTAGHHETMAWVVRDATVSEEAVLFRLGQFPYFNFLFPADRYLRDRCRFIYEGGTNPTVDGRCAAVNASETCDKSFEGAAGCAGRDNQTRYGGFPNLLVPPHPLLP